MSGDPESERDATTLVPTPNLLMRGANYATGDAAIHPANDVNGGRLAPLAPAVERIDRELELALERQLTIPRNGALAGAGNAAAATARVAPAPTLEPAESRARPYRRGSIHRSRITLPSVGRSRS